MKKDKARVENEHYEDHRLLAFLDLESSEGESKDFHILIKAYQSMLPEDYDRFLKVFVGHNKDINGMNIYGQTALDIVASHKKSTDYVNIIKAHGGKLSRQLKAS